MSEEETVTDSQEVDSQAVEQKSTATLVDEGEIAGDYLEELLDILDFDGDIDLDVEGQRALVSIVEGNNQVDSLIGKKGEVLDALQELTRLAVQRQTGFPSLLMLDISHYRQNRRKSLQELAKKISQEVLSTGEQQKLDPMTPFERKVIHDTVAIIDGVESASEGETKNRRVVISPTS